MSELFLRDANETLTQGPRNNEIRNSTIKRAMLNTIGPMAMNRNPQKTRGEFAVDRE